MELTYPLRVDDFRCHDPFLVEVPFGREREAVAFRNDALADRLELGLLIKDKRITDFGFLEHAAALKRLFVANGAREFWSFPLQRLAALEDLAVDTPCIADVQVLASLRRLCVTWSARMRGLAGLQDLRTLHLDRFDARGSGVLAAPAGLQFLQVSTRNTSLDLRGVTSLEQLHVCGAPALESLAVPGPVDLVHLARVARSGALYARLPNCTRTLEIDRCGPIGDWNFLADLPELTRLLVIDTKCPPAGQVPAHIADRVEIEIM